MYDDSHLEMAYEDTVSDVDWEFCGGEDDYDYNDDSDEVILSLVAFLYADEDGYNGPTYMEYDD